MRRNDPGKAVNRRHVLVPVYDPDPNGHAFFHTLAARQQRGINGHDGTAYRPMAGYAQTAFHGDTPAPQAFTGQAALGTGLGSGRPIADGRTDLQRETSTLLMNNQMRIYAERLRRTIGTGSTGSALATPGGA